jgi:hypothetical protein
MTGEVLEHTKELTLGAKLLNQLKENRVEAMIVTILLYSTGLLEKAYVAGVGVC